MRIEQFEDNQSWLNARKGKITGTRLKDLISKTNAKKIGFYEIIAENLSISEEDFDGYVPNETAMDRGTRMQTYAIDRFKQETGKKVDETRVIWSRDDEERIALSPDGVISSTEAIETKCLSSARHVEAYLTKEIPGDYEYQKLQYFIVNPKLKTLYFVFYDTRLPSIQYFVIEVHREDIIDEIEIYLKMQKAILKEIDQIMETLTF